MLSFHSRSAITENIFEYYGVSQIDGKMISSELKWEGDYEDNLVAQMTKHHLYDGKSPDKLTTIINKDIAPLHIEESLLNNNGNEAAKEFMKDQFASQKDKTEPKVPFAVTMKIINTPIFANLFDIEPTDSGRNEAVNVSRDVMRRFCVAYEAKRPVDIKRAASHEMSTVPLNTFHTDKTMRPGNKSDLVNNVYDSAKVKTCQLIPSTDYNQTHYVIDGMAYVYKILTK